MAMYKKGDVRVKASPNVNEYEGDLCDARHRAYPLPPGLYAFLPHSCDEWIIGTEANVRQMIDDLTEILEGM